MSNAAKHYPVEMGFIVEPTDRKDVSRILSEINDEDVVLASDYDRLEQTNREMRNLLLKAHKALRKRGDHDVRKEIWEALHE